MVRGLTAFLAVSLVSMFAAADEMKPKFGDIDGVYYTDVAYDRAACRQAVKTKIALCRQNTGFISNTENRDYPGCLPVFRVQSRVCSDHFRSEAYSLRASACSSAVILAANPSRSATASRFPSPAERLSHLCACT